MSYRWTERRGFTLVEILLGAAIGLIVLGIIYQLWAYSRYVSSTAHQGYVLTEDLSVAFRGLQREMVETSLASIVVDTGSVSFLSARDEKGFQTGPDGAPRWLKMVRYKLRPTSQDPTVGDLMREEKPLQAHTLPFPEPAMWFGTISQDARVMTHNLLSAGYDVALGPGGDYAVKEDDNAERGFAVRFIRHAGHHDDPLSPVNPCSRSDHQQHGWTKNSTGLIQFTMGLLEKDSSTGKVGFIELRLRVRPAHN